MIAASSAHACSVSWAWTLMLDGVVELTDIASLLQLQLRLKSLLLPE
jgi:hypothetical protein